MLWNVKNCWNTIFLPVTDCIVDLGVMYDNHLSFSPHINKIVNNASWRANLILKCFTTRDPLVLLKAFNTFVRPIVEYATVVWNPSAKMSIRRIEAILQGLHNLSYNARLEALNEHSLESRRIRADLTFCYKMLHRIVDIDCRKFLKPVQSSVTRGHQFKLC